MVKMSRVDQPQVKKVRQAFVDAGMGHEFFDLQSDRPLAEPGAFVQSKIFTVGNRYVLTLIAGDQTCREDQLPRIFNLSGDVITPSGDLVRAITGFPQGAVPPFGLVSKLPMVMDASLKRFETLYVTAGDAQCVFAISNDDLKRQTGAIVSYAVAE